MPQTLKTLVQGTEPTSTRMPPAPLVAGKRKGGEKKKRKKDTREDQAGISPPRPQARWPASTPRSLVWLEYRSFVPLSLDTGTAKEKGREKEKKAGGRERKTGSPAPGLGTVPSTESTRSMPPKGRNHHVAAAL